VERHRIGAFDSVSSCESVSCFAASWSIGTFVVVRQCYPLKEAIRLDPLCKRMLAGSQRGGFGGMAVSFFQPTQG
jgi:hypothetical protein